MDKLIDNSIYATILKLGDNKNKYIEERIMLLLRKPKRMSKKSWESLLKEILIIQRQNIIC